MLYVQKVTPQIFVVHQYEDCLLLLSLINHNKKQSKMSLTTESLCEPEMRALLLPHDVLLPHMKSNRIEAEHKQKQKYRNNSSGRQSLARGN